MNTVTSVSEPADMSIHGPFSQATQAQEAALAQGPPPYPLKARTLPGFSWHSHGGNQASCPHVAV